jgi:hypothetical protein
VRLQNSSRARRLAHNTNFHGLLLRPVVVYPMMKNNQALTISHTIVIVRCGVPRHESWNETVCSDTTKTQRSIFNRTEEPSSSSTVILNALSGEGSMSEGSKLTVTGPVVSSFGRKVMRARSAHGQ